MVQKTVLKIDLSCLKCKKKLLKAVSSVEGVDKMEADSTKGTLSVTGKADPYKIIVSARKGAGGRFVEVVSVGLPPPPAKPPEAQKKAEEKNNIKKSGEDEKQKKKKIEEVENSFHDPLTCPECQRYVFVQLDRPWNNQPANPSCFIM